MGRIHAGLSVIMPPSSGQAWFLTIIMLVVLMRLLLVPLFIKQMHSMRKMSALNPQLMELRKKYKGDKQTLNEETMRLYRENGVNPLGGCLPLLAQMPMFFALFSVLRAISDAPPGKAVYGLPPEVVQSAKNANILCAKISEYVLFKRYPTPALATATAGGTAGGAPAAAPAKPSAVSRLTSAKSVAPAKPSATAKPSSTARPSGTAKPAAGAKPATASAPSGKSAPKSAAGQTSRKKPQAGTGSAGAKPAGSGRPPAAAGQRSSANGSGTGSGLLRRLGRGKPEPEPEAEQPEVKLVRQQRVRQSRSKRSGKR